MVIAYPDEAYLAQVARTRPVHGLVAGTANAAAIAALG